MVSFDISDSPPYHPCFAETGDAKFEIRNSKFEIEPYDALSSEARPCTVRP